MLGVTVCFPNNHSFPNSRLEEVLFNQHEIPWFRKLMLNNRLLLVSSHNIYSGFAHLSSVKTYPRILANLGTASILNHTHILWFCNLTAHCHLVHNYHFFRCRPIRRTLLICSPVLCLSRTPQLEIQTLFTLLGIPIWRCWSQPQPGTCIVFPHHTSMKNLTSNVFGQRLRPARRPLSHSVSLICRRPLATLLQRVEY